MWLNQSNADAGSACSLSARKYDCLKHGTNAGWSVVWPFLPLGMKYEREFIRAAASLIPQ